MLLKNRHICTHTHIHVHTCILHIQKSWPKYGNHSIIWTEMSWPFASHRIQCGKISHKICTKRQRQAEDFLGSGLQPPKHFGDRDKLCKAKISQMILHEVYKSYKYMKTVPCRYAHMFKLGFDDKNFMLTCACYTPYFPPPPNTDIPCSARQLYKRKRMREERGKESGNERNVSHLNRENQLAQIYIIQQNHCWTLEKRNRFACLIINHISKYDCHSPGQQC